MCSMLAAPSIARAAEDHAPASPAGADVVKLKNGDFYRGTIVELLKSDHVVLLLPSGESRRFQMSEVTYAGPASEVSTAATVAPPPSAAPGPSQVQVHFTANQSDVRLMLRTGATNAVGYGSRGAVAIVANSYDGVCTAPCDGSLPSGTQRLALSLAGGAPVDVADAISLTNATVLAGSYKSNASTRATGGVLIAAGTIVGVGLMVLSILHKENVCDSFGGCQEQTSVNIGETLAGVGIWLGGAIAGLVITMSSPDEAHLEVNPVGGSVAPGRSARPVPASGSDNED
jgi:hypothetical protein